MSTASLIQTWDDPVCDAPDPSDYAAQARWDIEDLRADERDALAQHLEAIMGEVAGALVVYQADRREGKANPRLIVPSLETAIARSALLMHTLRAGDDVPVCNVDAQG